MDTTRGLHVRAHHSGLRGALTMALRRHFPSALESAEPDPQPGDVVLVTRDTTTLSAVRNECANGIRVVVLAPTAIPEEARAFSAAGVYTYLAMDVDLAGLIAVIATALA